MTCLEAAPLLAALVDDELALPHALLVEEHVQNCTSCRPTRDASLALREAARQLPPFALPAAVTRLGLPDRAGPRRAWLYATSAAAVAALVVLALRPAEGATERDVFTAHARSLQESHATDVASSDQHTVKPWFQGRLPFAVPARDYRAEGFALAGGRLDVIDGRQVAALVYRHGAHVVNHFVWPAPGAGDSGFAKSSRDGYRSERWTSGGLSHWLVSDVAEPELRTFAERLRGE